MPVRRKVFSLQTSQASSTSVKSNWAMTVRIRSLTGMALDEWCSSFRDADLIRDWNSTIRVYPLYIWLLAPCYSIHSCVHGIVTLLYIIAKSKETTSVTKRYFCCSYFIQFSRSWSHLWSLSDLSLINIYFSSW